MVLLSHPTGNEFVRHAVRAFVGASVLGEFHTGVSWNPDGWMHRLLPGRLQAELGRRSYAPEVRSFVKNHPLRELGRLASQTMGWKALTRHETGPCSIDGVFHDLDRRVARRLRRVAGFSAVYAYEDGAAFSFAAARGAGVKTIYDLPIGYWRAGQKVFKEEAEREPEWACTLTGTLDSAAKLERKDEELRLSDAIVVASSFTKSTLAEMPGMSAPVFVVPYGAPAVAKQVREASRSGPLRVMFAGSLTQRKGVSYFLKACEQMRDAVEVTIVGRKPTDQCVPLEAALKKHRYIVSVPHHEMLAEMARQDVLVFPSLFEGFGLVILEAMAQGVPVITTEATAGPEVITEGEDGFIVPIRDASAIASRLDRLATDRELLRTMSEAAYAKAARLGWEHYREGLVTAVKAVIQPARQELAVA